MEKYKIEYFELKNRLVQLKKDIQEILEKYDFDNDGFNQKNKLMIVLSELYELRKSDFEGYGYRYHYEPDILNNYDDNCGVPIEDLQNILELFIERKKAKRRIGFIKGLIIRKFLYN